MRLFISILQNGRTDEAVGAEKSEITDWLKRESDHVELIDTYVHEDAPVDGDRAGVWYLGESLKRMAAADMVVFATGAEKARGCKIELEVCKAYGIPFRFR